MPWLRNQIIVSLCSVLLRAKMIHFDSKCFPVELSPYHRGFVKNRHSWRRPLRSVLAVCQGRRQARSFRKTELKKQNNSVNTLANHRQNTSYCAGTHSAAVGQWAELVTP